MARQEQEPCRHLWNAHVLNEALNDEIRCLFAPVVRTALSELWWGLSPITDRAPVYAMGLQRLRHATDPLSARFKAAYDRRVAFLMAQSDTYLPLPPAKWRAG